MRVRETKMEAGKLGYIVVIQEKANREEKIVEMKRKGWA